MTATWYAEDIPASKVVPRSEQDVALSVHRYYAGDSKDEARNALAQGLREAATYRHLADLAEAYVWAAKAVEAGVDLVVVNNRCYRLHQYTR
jgi:hypothetical protein